MSWLSIGIISNTTHKPNNYGVGQITETLVNVNIPTTGHSSMKASQVVCQHHEVRSGREIIDFTLLGFVEPAASGCNCQPPGAQVCRPNRAAYGTRETGWHGTASEHSDVWVSCATIQILAC